MFARKVNGHIASPAFVLLQFHMMSSKMLLLVSDCHNMALPFVTHPTVNSLLACEAPFQTKNDEKMHPK